MVAMTVPVEPSLRTQHLAHECPDHCVDGQRHRFAGRRNLIRQIWPEEAVWQRCRVVHGGQFNGGLYAVVLDVPSWSGAVGLGVFGVVLSIADNE